MYDHLLFDADGTLFNFMAAEKWAISRFLEQVGVEATEESIATYSEINNEVWLSFEKGELTMDELKVERFAQFNRLHNISLSAKKSSELYSSLLSRTDHLYSDTLPLLTLLKSANIPMSIITNGIASVQRGRLKASHTDSFFVSILISEELGVQKPDPLYFKKSLEIINSTGVSVTHPLIIGDSPTSDIKGGIESNIDTCWINRYQMKREASIRPTYEISSLWELIPLLNSNGLSLPTPHQK